MSDRVIDITPQLQAARDDYIRSRQSRAAGTVSRTLLDSAPLKVTLTYTADTLESPDLPHQQLRQIIHAAMQEQEGSQHPNDFTKMPCKKLADMLYWIIASNNRELIDCCITIAVAQNSITFDYRK